jgi:hypothetical protein
MGATSPGDVVTVLLAEYDRLKAEQVARISLRDNLLYAVLGSAAAVCAVTFTAKTPALLLLLPAASTVLGWVYLVNDHKVSAIGRYLRDVLDPRLTALIGAASPVFGWEIANHADRRCTSRKMLWLCVDLLAFAAPGVAAVVAVLSSGPASAAVLAVAAAEAVMVGVLAWQIIAYAEPWRLRQPLRPRSAEAAGSAGSEVA